MALEGVLANIPGLAGYLATQQNDQRQALGDMQGITGILNAVRQQEQMKLMEQDLALKRLAERRQQQQLDMGSQLLGMGTPGAPTTQGGAIGTPVAGASGVAPSRTAGGIVKNLTPEQVLGGGMAGLWKPADVLKIREMGRPKVEVRDGMVIAIDQDNPENTVIASTFPVVTPSGQAILPQRDQTVPGGIRMGSPVGAFDVQRANAAGAMSPAQINAAILDAQKARDSGIISPQEYTAQVSRLLASPDASQAPAENGAQVLRAPNEAAAVQLGTQLQNAGAKNFQIKVDNPDPAGGGIANRGGLSPSDSRETFKQNRIAINQDFMKNDFRPAIDEAKSAREGNTVIETFRSLPITQKTGWGTEAVAAAASLLTGLGIAPDAAKKFAANAEQFRSLAMQQNWQLLASQKGMQTEGDAKRAAQVFAQLGNTPQANDFIWDYTKAVNDLRIRRARFYEENRAKAENAGDMASLGNQWSRSIEDYSIFNEPSMKKWANAAPQSPAPAPSQTAPASGWSIRPKSP